MCSRRICVWTIEILFPFISLLVLAVVIENSKKWGKPSMTNPRGRSSSAAQCYHRRADVYFFFTWSNLDNSLAIRAGGGGGEYRSFVGWWVLCVLRVLSPWRIKMRTSNVLWWGGNNGRKLSAQQVILPLQGEIRKKQMKLRNLFVARIEETSIFPFEAAKISQFVLNLQSWSLAGEWHSKTNLYVLRKLQKWKIHPFF